MSKINDSSVVKQQYATQTFSLTARLKARGYLKLEVRCYGYRI